MSDTVVVEESMEEKERKRGRPPKPKEETKQEVKEQFDLKTVSENLRMQLKETFSKIVADLVDSLANFIPTPAVQLLVFDKFLKLTKTPNIGEVEGKIYALDLLIKFSKTSNEMKHKIINDILAEYLKV
jgi:hypothetical protein